MKIKYVHTNIVAKDWRTLAQFYISVFNCKALNPERDLKGPWLDDLTNIDNAHIKGIHLSMPGYTDGPTLEIFQYHESLAGTSEINQRGFAHIAFQTDDVETLLKKLETHGGKRLGKIVQNTYPELGTLYVCYAKDPEGNIIELQSWKHK